MRNGETMKGVGDSERSRAKDVQVVAERWLKQLTVLARLDLSGSEAVPSFTGFWHTLFILKCNSFSVICFPKIVSSSVEGILSYKFIP